MHSNGVRYRWHSEGGAKRECNEEVSASGFEYREAIQALEVVLVHAVEFGNILFK